MAATANVAGSGPDLAALERDLRDRVDGEVRFDTGTRGAYATDGSNYRQPPIGVVLPRTVDAAVEAVACCREHGAPLLSRGGGTSLAGQCTNHAVVIDWTKYCHRLESVDPESRSCVVEPGIVLDDLNAELAPHGLMFGPRPSTHPACALGGMIGNNSCGSTAQVYGKTVDNVVRLEVLTYDGTRMWVGPTTDAEYDEIVAAGGRRAQIYEGLRRIRDTYLAQIRQRYPDIPRRVSGYNLDSLLPESRFDLARALVGSEGTLVTVLRAELSLVRVPAARALVVLGYPDIAAAADAVPALVEHGPHQLEGMDDVLVGFEREEHLHPEALEKLPKGSGWLFCEFTGETQDQADGRAHRAVDALRGTEHEPHADYFDDPEWQQELWDLREGGLGATAHPPGGRHETWEGWEDAAVPPDRLGDYLRDFSKLLEEYDFRELAALYGHFGQGCVHTRIPFGLQSADGVATFREFVERAADLVVSYGGSLSGEHGDGQSRGELLPRMFGPEIMSAFGEVKALFDPDDRMNPGKVVEPNPLDSHLRLGADFEPWQPETVFGFPDDKGSFVHAAMRCVGVGKCRNAGDGGVMCPSYRATREEEHSTRGRARLLFEMIRGGPDAATGSAGSTVTDGWRSTAVRDALDLCLACKGCKSDCPVEVDMATYKAEFLSHHYQGRLRPAAHYSMGWLPVWARLAALAPGAVNAVARAPGIGRMLKVAGGVATQRALPVFAGERFTDWFARRPPRPAGPRGEIVVWPDTFTNSFHPAIGRACVEVLEAAGFGVRVPRRAACCGLTWISTGQLRTAQRVARRTLDVLRADLRAGRTVVGLEPSCTAVFRSDLPELFPDDEDVRRLADQTRTLAEVLTDAGWSPPQGLGGLPAVVQTHCHQHAIMGDDPDRALLKALGVDAEVLAFGCCGLAGNFGFEAGHYEVSQAVAEDALLPRIRELPATTAVLADGFSCRTQIEQSDTGRVPLHLAELAAAAVRGIVPAPGEAAEAVLADRPGRAGGG